MDEEKDMFGNLSEIIKSQLRKNMNEYYDEYKAKCLKELDNEIELQIDKILGSVLEGLRIEIKRDVQYVDPIIQVVIKNEVVVKREGE